MANSVRYKRAAAVFNEAARLRLCQSSGSEHYSPDNNFADLSDLVNSFIEKDFIRIQEQTIGNNNINQQDGDDDSKLQESESYCSISDTMNMLQNLLNNKEDADFKREIHLTARGISIPESCSSSHGFKRTLMSRLRQQNFDAGLCKSRWEKFGKYPRGEYEYVDVNFDGNRFIVEVFLAAEFEIARPSTGYAQLLDVFPQVFIGKPEELKQVVRLMCSAMKRSMKDMNLHAPPWRRNGYLQAKWFGPYKRTVNEISAADREKQQSIDESSAAAKRSIGFQAFPLKAYSCRDGFATNVGLKVGYLTAAFNGNALDMQ